MEVQLVAQPTATEGRIEVKIPVAEDSYRYTSLNPGQIRLVVLLPSTQGSQDIVIDLLNVELEAVQGGFEALSYTWGTPNPPRKIRCAHCSITVTPNLYNALLALRGYDSTEARFLWIDQISINQADIPEKNVQVAQMQDVYKAASHVMVWLSADIWQDQSLVGDLQNFAEFVNSVLDPHEGDEKQLIAEDANRVWESVLKVYGSTSYFRRVWIIQELICAQQSWFMIGGSSVLWQGLLEIGVLLQTNIQKDARFRPFQNANTLPASFRTSTRCFQKLATMWIRFHPRKAEQLLATQGVKKEHYVKWTLLDLIRKSFFFEATEPKDLVYAISGLLSFTDYCLPQDIHPNYSRDFEYMSLILQVFVYGYTKQASLENLIYSTFRVLPELPSWMGGLYDNFLMPFKWVLTDSWTASGDLPAHISPTSSNLRLLSFRGTRIAKIQELNTIFLDPKDQLEENQLTLDGYFVSSTTDLDYLFTYVSKCWEMVVWPNNPTLAGFLWEDFSETFPLSTISNFTLSSMDPNDFMEALDADGALSLPKLVTLLVQAAIESDTATFMDIFPKLPDIQRLFLGGQGMRFGVAKYLAQVRGTPNEEDSQATLRDRIMCWTPPDAQIGDEVCIIHGLRVPMLIRASVGDSGRHYFVGPCYTHGLMFGEDTTLLGSRAEELLMM